MRGGNSSTAHLDRMVLQGMEFYGFHGDLEAERALGSRFEVDLEILADLAPAGRSDELADTIDYVRCFQVVRDVVENRQYRLLEGLAEAIAETVLAQPRALGVRVRVAKQPPVPGRFARFAVDIERPRPE